jgi:hypothetical protein
VGERHVADAEAVQRTQHAERLVDRMAALRAEQRGDPAVGEGRAGLFRRRDDSQLRRISLRQRVHQLGLLDDRGDRRVTSQPTRYVHGPELNSDPAGPQSGEICVQVGLWLLQIDFECSRSGLVDLWKLSQRPREVVVSIDQRSGLQHLPCTFERRAVHYRDLVSSSSNAWTLRHQPRVTRSCYIGTLE